MSNSIGKVNIKFGADSSGFEKGLSSIETSLKKAGKWIATAGVAGITAAVAGIGAASMKAAGQFNDAMQSLAVGTGATGESLKAFGQQLQAAIAGTANDIGATAQAMDAFNSRMGATGTTLEALAKSAATLGRLTGQSVSEIAAQSATAFNAFGVGAEEAVAKLDYLNRVSQKSGISVTELGKVMGETAGIFTASGKSMEFAASFIAQMENSGMKLKGGMSGLNTAVQKLAESLNVDMGTAFDTLIASLQQAGSEQEAVKIAALALGEAVGPTFANFVRKGLVSFEEYNKAMMGSTSSIQEMDDAVETLGERWTRFHNDLLPILSSIGNVMTSVMMGGIDLLERLSNGLVAVIGKISEVSNGLASLARKWYGGGFATKESGAGFITTPSNALAPDTATEAAVKSVSTAYNKLTDSVRKSTSQVKDFSAQSVALDRIAEGSKADYTAKAMSYAEMLAAKEKQTAQDGREVKERELKRTAQTYREISDEMARSYNRVEQVGINTAKSIQSAFDSGIDGIVRGTSKMSDIVSNIFYTMAGNIAKQALSPLTNSVSSLLGAATGAAAGGGGGGFLGSLFGGFFAEGGRPPMGKVSVVGERGPELFVPDTAGTIVPNHQIGGSGGGNLHMLQPVIIGVNEQIASQIRAAVPGMVQGAVSAIEAKAKTGGSFTKTLRG